MPWGVGGPRGLHSRRPASKASQGPRCPRPRPRPARTTSPAFHVPGRPGRLARSVSRLKTRLFGIPPFPSYQGEVKDKAAVLRRARFAYCYENSRDLSNYITEKIFDSLVQGCVPVYWGADNVLDYIPAGCFVDRRNFRDTAEVHQHLLALSDADFVVYQRNIREFLASETARRFSSERVVQTIVERIGKDLRAR